MIINILLIGALVAVPISGYAQKNIAQFWKPVDGQAIDIAIGGNGMVAVVNQDGHVYIYNHGKKTWRPVGKAISRITVGQAGDLWGVDKAGVLRQFSGTSWNAVGQGAVELVATRDHHIIVTTNTGSIARYSLQSGQWSPIPGFAKKLAVDNEGRLWRIDENGDIARRLDDAWIGVDGKAQDITADNSGQIFIAGIDNFLYQWVEDEAVWRVFPSNVTAVNVAADGGQVWRVDQSGQIFALGSQKSNEVEGIVEGEPGDGAIDENTIPDTSTIIFNRVPDNTTLTELSIGAEGSVFGLTALGNIKRWSNNEKRFNDFPGRVNRLVVRNNGLPLAIGTKDNLVQHDGEAWRLINLNQQLVDVTVFQNNQFQDSKVLAINTKEQSIKLSDSLTAFSLLPQQGQKIAAQRDGGFWVIDSFKRLFQCAAMATCKRQSINAEDIAIGPAGTVFIVDTHSTLWRFNASSNGFDLIRRGNTARVAVGPKDRPWILNNKGQVLQAGYFTRDESDDRNLALKTKATEKVTQTAPTRNTGIQITQSVSFAAVTVPTVGNGIALRNGMRDITVGVNDTVLVTGYEDPCIAGKGQSWVYNPVSKSFNHLDYLKRINLYTLIAVDDLVSGSVNGDKPPANPLPAIPSLIGEWNKSCGNQSNLLTYVGNVFASSAAQTNQNFNAAVLAFPLDLNQQPDIDFAADGYVANIAPGNELELFVPEKADDVDAFNNIQFMRVGIGASKHDIWAVSTTNNVYQFIRSSDSFKLRSFNADDKALDVGVGQDGTVFIVNTSGVLKKWDPLSQRFIRTNKNGVTRVAVDSRGNPIVANFPSSKTVYFGR